MEAVVQHARGPVVAAVRQYRPARSHGHARHRRVNRRQAPHCAMAKEHGGAMMSADLPERLNMMEQHMTLHLDSLRAIKAAVQPLYSVLSDEQKKTANDIMKGPMGRM